MIRRWIVAGILCAPLLASADPIPRIYALVVGNNDGGETLPRLRYADDDALRMYELLRQFSPAENIALLSELDAQTRTRLQKMSRTAPQMLLPTKVNVIASFDRLRNQMRRAVVADPTRPVHLFVFFSGHGESGYLLLHRPQVDAPAGRLSALELQQVLADSPAAFNAVFIDACKAQSLFGSKGGARGDAVDPEAGPDFSDWMRDLKRAADNSPTGIMTSTVSDQPAGEAQDLGAGYFSHVLVSGLSGAADADHDGVVRYSELAAFVAYYTRRLAGQRPWFRAPLGKWQQPILSLRSQRARVRFSGDVEGHLVVTEAQTGAVVVESYKDGQPLELVLAPGNYRAILVRDRDWGQFASISMVGRPTVVSADAFQSAIPLGGVSTARGEVGADVVTSNAAFDPAQSGFDKSFNTRDVAAWIDAYEAGMSNAVSSHIGDIPGKHRLAAAYVVDAAPTDPWQVAHGIAMTYRYRITSSWFAAARLSWAASSHIAVQSQTPFQLQRIGAQIETGYQLNSSRRVQWSIGGYVGWQCVLVTEEVAWSDDNSSRRRTVLSGDAASGRAGIQVGWSLQLARSFDLSLLGAYGMQWIAQAEKRSLFFRPQLMLGAGYDF